MRLGYWILNTEFCILLPFLFAPDYTFGVFFNPGYNQCYTCKGVASPQDCTTAKPCLSYLKCYILEEEDNNGTVTYSAGCTGPMYCPKGTLQDDRNKTGLLRQLTCCSGSYCNGKKPRAPTTTTIQPTTTTTATTTTAVPRRVCYQCYDVRLDSRGQLNPCYHTTVCSSITSKCLAVYREKHGIVTVDMDCEENMKFSISGSTVNVLCSSSCSSDRCNRNNDCRKAIVTTVQAPTSVSSPTTTAFHTTSTTTPTSFYKGVECMHCKGPLCGVLPDMESRVTCPDTLAPFCLNKVINDGDGNKHVTKRCGGIADCDSKWLSGSLNRSECVTFDPSEIYTSSFECTYCCVTSNCNRFVHPKVGTLYIGIL